MILWFSRCAVLRVHGHVSCILYQRNQHPIRGERTGDRAVIHYRCVRPHLQLHRALRFVCFVVCVQGIKKDPTLTIKFIL